VFGFDLLDVTSYEGPGDILLFDASGAQLDHVETAAPGANGVDHVVLDGCGVRSLAIALYGSAAVDNLAFCPGGEPEVCDGVDNDGDGLTDEQPDLDGDGFSDCGDDCDDSDPDVHPGAPELCDGKDSDCDGLVPGDELDGDGDGFGACHGDCDDAAVGIFPGAPEACDGLDNDCDGQAGSSFETDWPDDWSWRDARLRGNRWRIDSSVELAGLSFLLQTSIGATITFLVYESGLEEGPYVHVASSEIEAATDELAWHASPPISVPLQAGRWYLMVAHWRSTAAYGWAMAPGFPLDAPHGAIVSGVTQDLLWWPPVTAEADFGEVSYPMRHVFADEGDADGDGSPMCEDCDDTRATAFPGAPELCNLRDDDCDGELSAQEVDADGDGQLLCEGDCDDDDPDLHIGAAELCDGIDNNCDGFAGADSAGEVDIDQDGALSCVDCDDSDAAIHEGAAERCNGLDDDCDGLLPADEADVDGDGWMLCEDDCDDDEARAEPDGVEVKGPTCEDGVDNDCDGSIDDADPDCLLVEEGPLKDEGCQSECDGAGVRFGARMQDRLVLALLFGVALIRRRPPGRDLEGH
jgi:hypothetical protein